MPLSAAQWEVWGPQGRFTLRVVEQAAAAFTTPFPGPFSFDNGPTPDWDHLPMGRYWVVLYAWEGPHEVPICKVPFRLYDSTSKFWRVASTGVVYEPGPEGA